MPPDQPKRKPKRHGKGRIIALIVAIIVIVVGAGLGVFLTWRAGVWGGKPVPEASSLVTPDADGEVKAEDVEKALKGKGFAVKRTVVFSGKSKGLFLGYDGVKPGDRVKAGGTLIVQESGGPGVPKDTLGKMASGVTTTFDDMGVPVHYKQVVVNDTQNTPEGSIVATSPAAGQPVSDDDDGIYIGVAVEGDGLGVDILGMDKDELASKLEGEGYAVTLQPHYSSKQYVGKISGSSPAPGSPLTAGQSVTLYYGVDKSSNMDLLTKVSDFDGMTMVNGNASPMVGTYCKSEVKDADKDCITLEADDGPYHGSSGGGFLAIKGREPADPYDALGLNNFSQDISGALVDPNGYPGMSKSELPLANHLLLKDWGMFELYAGLGLRNCGDTVMTSTVGEYCDGGTYEMRDPSSFTSDTAKSHGTTYDMKDFLVYVPVGSDIQALTDSGYFDDAALKTAEGQKAVDADRPFILMRDSSLYDETEVSADNVGRDGTVNPFVPTNVNGSNALVKMKPAISDSSVYYLVESAEPDWDALPDADVEDAGKTDSGESDGSGKDGADSASESAFRLFAGTYRYGNRSGRFVTDLTLNDDGTFSGLYQSSIVGNGSDSPYPQSQWKTAFHGSFKSATKNSDGSYMFVCDTEAYSIEGTRGETYVEDGVEVTNTGAGGIEPCQDFIAYPKGYDSTKLPDGVANWVPGGIVQEQGGDRYVFSGPLPERLIVNDSTHTNLAGTYKDYEAFFYNGFWEQ